MSYYLHIAGDPYQGRQFASEDKALDKTQGISNENPERVYILTELVENAGELVSGIHSIWYQGKRFTPHSYVEQLELENEKMDEYLSHLPVDWQEGDED